MCHRRVFILKIRPGCTQGSTSFSLLTDMPNVGLRAVAWVAYIYLQMCHRRAYILKIRPGCTQGSTSFSLLTYYAHVQFNYSQSDTCTKQLVSPTTKLYQHQRCCSRIHPKLTLCSTSKPNRRHRIKILRNISTSAKYVDDPVQKFKFKIVYFQHNT